MISMKEILGESFHAIKKAVALYKGRVTEIYDKETNKYILNTKDSYSNKFRKVKSRLSL